MRGRFCCFVIILQLVSWVCVTSRPFAPNDGLSVPCSSSTRHRPKLRVSGSNLDLHKAMGHGSAIQARKRESLKGSKSMEKMAEVSSSSSYKGVRKIGSSLPSCEHKCFGCNPCEAIQVPATTSHFGVQYTNYEPEGWKCKCGPSFYRP